MLFQIKKNPLDFIVQENILPLTGKGEFFYIQFSKTNFNTMEIINYLCSHFSLHRSELGIAGLKDKNAFTIQWISIHYEKLLLLGKQEFLDVLSKFGEIVSTNFHNEPLTIGANTGNTFTISIKILKTLSPEQEKRLIQNCNSVENTGFPNAFGQQRFGKGLKSCKKAIEFFSSGGIINPELATKKFTLQTVGNLIFNTYITQKTEILNGDILCNSVDISSERKRESMLRGIKENNVVKLFHPEEQKHTSTHQEKFILKEFFYPVEVFYNQQEYRAEERTPTAPILGTGLLLPPSNSEAFNKERLLLSSQNNFENILKTMQKVGLHAHRRTSRVKLQDFSYSYTPEKITLHFTLPSGSYATVLIGKILEGIDNESIICNKLGISVLFQAANTE